MNRPLALTAWFPGMLFLAALLVLGCAADERLTLDEYADFCAGGLASAVELLEPESVTWGDLLALGEPSLERLRSVEPPEVLADFHRASIRTLDFLVRAAGDQPAEAAASPLALGFDALRVATQLRRAVDDLPADARRALQEVECF